MTSSTSKTPLPAVIGGDAHPDADAHLVALSRRGDAKAFQRLMERYLPAVYNHLYRMTRNHELSEDMTQEAFINAYRRLDAFDGGRSFKPWILRIATNAMISALRKPSAQISLDAEDETGRTPEIAARTADDPEEQVERRLAGEAVLKALATLDDKYSQALLLRYQQDLSYEDVALALDLPLNTVRTRLRRGLEKLREVLINDGNLGGAL
jgi:RNA polymerase sigma-70 factor (ECF subfamily)